MELGCLQNLGESYLSFLEGIRELTLKFAGSATGLIGDSSPFLGVDSIEGHNQVSGKGFPTTGPRIEVGNVVIHRRHRCPDVLCIVVMLMGYVVNWNCMSMDFKVLRITRLIRASFGITRLICVSFRIIRLIGVSFGVTRLIRVSFGITRLIRASSEITRLMCKGTAWGRPTRGKKDV
ncbi:hypothetical protein E6C27_scaffold1204G00490 [Cucumis melo var. makuwa]|uniref:Uncharacterized protein n=1 Tax=Cucumis melo var. makuwa TaxID=1194695 RepID=A0A5A7SLM6_CUCMM|nr:hypothetical protein E6C27_scaffold1204G00490 [Cucumis melo var. makuwa]